VEKIRMSEVVEEQNRILTEIEESLRQEQMEQSEIERWMDLHPEEVQMMEEEEKKSGQSVLEMVQERIDKEIKVEVE
jgi:hypothetical protein